MPARRSHRCPDRSRADLWRAQESRRSKAICAWVFSRERWRGCRATVIRVTLSLTQGKSKDDASEVSNVRLAQAQKKPRTMPGLLYRWTLDEDSVPARHRATPVEAVDKLAADRVDPLLGVV